MDDQSLRLTRKYGVMISVAAAIVALAYTLGILRRSYWALAVPVSTVLAIGVGLYLWLGRTLMTTPSDSPDP